MSAGLLADCLATFGEDVAFTPAGGAPVTIRAVFDEDHVAVDPDTGAAVTTAGPTLGLRLSDLAAAPGRGDTVVVRSRTFKIVDWHPDSEGGGIAVLHEQ
jgi:hypothetical protein